VIECPKRWLLMEVMLHCRLLTVLRFKQGQQIEARASSGKY
jgi:hypothetical protein